MIINHQHRISVTATSARDLSGLLSPAELSLHPKAAALGSGISVTRHSFEKYCVAVDSSVPPGETRELTAREEASSLPFDSTAQTVAIPVRHEIREDIQTLLAEKRLLTAFQPVHSLPNVDVVGVEALTRFVGENGAGADLWFREAAEAGFGGELEIAALHCALTAARDIPRGMYLALNLTPATSRDPRVRNLLASATLPPSRIIIELTGSLQTAEGHDGKEGLGPLRAAGLRLAVSASGAAFNSFYRIAELRPDIIKLDRHLIEGIDRIEGQRVRVRAIIGLARQLGAAVVAEGIETIGELEEVIALEVTEAQGYLLGRPSIQPLDWAAWRMRVQAQPAGRATLRRALARFGWATA